MGARVAAAKRVLRIQQGIPPRPAAAPGGASAPRTGRSVFVSYAHHDRNEVQQFMGHFEPCAQRFALDVFFDGRDLRAGDVWDTRIQDALRRCEIFLLFVSSASLQSRFCFERELLVALEREYRGLCTIVPILLKPCGWEDMPLPGRPGEFLARFQALPGEGRAVCLKTGAMRDVVWKTIVDGLRDLLVPGDPHPPRAPAVTAVPSASQPVPRLLPYLCDQMVPEFKVREVLNEWRRKPDALILLLRAERHDCPDRFVERIVEQHLQKLLKRLAPSCGFNRSNLQWPTAEMKLKGDQLEAFFVEQIAERLLKDPYADEAEIVQHLLEQSAHQLFVVGLPPHPSADGLRAAMHGLAATLARLAPRVGAVRLMALLYSEDPAIKAIEPDAAWLTNGDTAVRIGTPPALTHFGLHDVHSWSQRDEVRQFVDLEREALEAAFLDAPARMTMNHFVRVVTPLLSGRG